MLTDAQKRLYARHILLDQLGAAGQERLCAAHALVAQDSEPRAAAVALDYLARAGLQVPTEPSASLANVVPGSATQVRHLAGRDALLECAAWLCGAFAAVETIKQLTGVGEPGRIDPELVLTAEVT